MQMALHVWLIMSSSYFLGGSLAELLRFAGVHRHAFWKEISYKVRV